MIMIRWGISDPHFFSRSVWADRSIGSLFHDLDLSKQIYYILISLCRYVREYVILNSPLDLSGQIDQLDPHFSRSVKADRSDSHLIV